MQIEEAIQEMARRIAEEFRPDRIILFGSHARGDATPDSDVDLLVIMRSVESHRQLRIAMRRAVNGLGVSKDILVLSTDEFETKRSIPGTIAYPAAQEGRVLYAA